MAITTITGYIIKNSLMTPKQILQASNRRRFPKPGGPWLMYQEWFRVLFLHFPMDTGLLRPLIPEDTILDVYEGKGWISILV